MKARAVRNGIGSTLFILLMVTALAAVRPIFLRLNGQLARLERSLITELEKRTGLLLEYGTLSPSILSGLSLRNVSLTDNATGKLVAEIRRVTVSYRFRDFFSPEPLRAVKSVVVNGVTLEYDAIEDGAVLRKLLALRPTADRTQMDFNNLARSLPFVVQLKNVALHYSDAHNDVMLSLKQMALTSPLADNGLEVKAEGTARYNGDYFKDGARRNTVAAAFSLDGTLFSDFAGSSATVRLLPVGGADYSISNTDLLVSYLDSKLQVRSMRSVLPYSLFFEVDTRERTVSARANFDHFDPLSLVRIRRLPQQLQRVRGSLLSGTFSFSAGGDGVHYSADGGMELSPALLGSRFLVMVRAQGNAESVQVSHLAATGEQLRAEFSGNYDIKRRIPSGSFLLDYFVLPNGNVISAEVYLEREGDGFMFVAPQLLLGDRFLTYVRANVIPAADSFDFELAFEDYSHADDYDTAEVSLAGSLLLGKRPRVQANLTVQNLFVDSLLQTAAFVLPSTRAEQLRAIAEKTAPYVFSSEAYFEASAGFKDFSFNMPLFFGANAHDDGQLLSLAAVGSNETVQLTRFDMRFGKMEVAASVQADLSRGFNDFSFFGDTTVNAMPYRFNGNFSAGYLAVSGDYSFDAAVAFGDSVAGSVRFSALPVSVGRNVLALSTNTRFSWSSQAGAALDIRSFDVEDARGNTALHPKFSFAGNANSYGLFLSSMTYSDAVSVLDGSGSILWNMSGAIFDSIHIDLSAESPVSNERLSLSADFMNPMQLPFSMEALQNDFYLSAEASLALFPVARLLRDQNADNTLTAQVSASGTVANPFVTVNVPQVSVSVSGSPLVAHGTFSLDDTGVHVTDIGGVWQTLRLSAFQAQFDPATFMGDASGNIDGEVLGETFHLPLSLHLERTTASLQGVWRVPQDFAVSLQSDEVSGGLFPRPFPISVTAHHSPGRLDIFSESGFLATLLADGTITARTPPGARNGFALNGRLGTEVLSLDFTNIRADLADISSRIRFDFLKFGAGIATGAFRIQGLLTDPEFSGAIAITDPEFTIPFLSQTPFKGKRVVASIGQSVLTAGPARFDSGKGQLEADVRVEFDRWKFGSLTANLRTLEGRYVPVDMNLPLVHYKGTVGTALRLEMTLNEMQLTGDIYGQNGDVELVTGNWQSLLSGDSFDFAALFSLRAASQAAPSTMADATALPFDFSADLRITAGNRVQVLYNPFLRGLIVPGNQLEFAMESASGALSIKGDIALRGGEILWLSRNFYMKEGRIAFNETQDNIDPRITVRAETRERDESGSPVTITLTAMNQPVSTFNPQFTASPAKSENEVMALLGQVVSADSENAGEVAVAGGDYLVNALVMRRIENALRAIGNFDIFSIRTAMLQNAVKQSQRGGDENEFGFGNFFDNSTVYIGKYFGSSVYVDALLRWTYDETKSDDNSDMNRLVFQPDIGFELSSPFVNIRWDLAPDIEEMQKTNNISLVPATSITLSWKISF